MLGFILGTACLIGFIATARAGRCGRRGWHGGCGPHAWHGGGGGCADGGCGHGHGWGGHHRGPFGHGPGFGGRGFWQAGGPRAFFLRTLFERLDATPGQEKVILAAIEELRAAAAAHHGELEQSRKDLAKAIKSPGFDEAHLGELFARHDAAIEAMRRAFVGSMAKVHEVLDERQRGALAEVVEEGPFAFLRGGWMGGARGPWG
jgi:Spy/CpxP family protein refolding chaperone